ncbi:MAG: cyclic nucleotide-binding domain-containing protein [Alphaproteobacteria bacterium]|nr:cyclic nucleotide-binding domain-containing protein [Alphaproteobacteria bacterium]
MSLRQISAGQIIFREGDESDKAYIIRSGKVEIFRQIKQGSLLLATLGEGEIFGEMGVLSELPRAAYASAATDVTVTEIHRDLFINHMTKQPEEVILVVRALMERLRETNRSVATLMNKQSQFDVAGEGRKTPPITRVIITPMSSFLELRMPKEGISTTSLPYRVGGLPLGVEPNPLDWNNLFVEDADNAIIARNHFAIQRGAEGLYISDRGSRTGTIVNGMSIGKDTSESYQATLNFGDNIVIAGEETSPYRFCITWQ